MTVWSDCVGYARFGVSMATIVAYLFHAVPFHWLIGSIFAGLHVVMTVVRAVLAMVSIVKMLSATLGISSASGGSALFAAALPAPMLLARRPESKERESVGRGMPLGLALLAGVGSLAAANLEAGAGLAHFAVAIATFPVICAAVWALRTLAKQRAD